MRTRLLRWSTVITGGILFGGLGGNCLPDDFLVLKVGEIVNGIIINVVNGFLPAGIGPV